MAELGYVAVTSSVNVTATSEAAGDIIATLPAIVLGGSTPVLVEFYMPWWGQTGATDLFFIALFDAIDGGAAAPVYRLWDGKANALSIQMPGVSTALWYTPVSGSHVFTLRGHTGASTTSIFSAGPGGLGNDVPGFLRVTTPGGIELAYAEITASAAVTATTEGTANTIVTLPAITADGTSAYLIEFYCAGYSHTSATVNSVLYLYQDGASIGALWSGRAHTAATPIGGFVAQRRLIPAAGSRTYSIRGATGSGTFTVTAGLAGSGSVDMPAFARIVRAA